VGGGVGGRREAEMTEPKGGGGGGEGGEGGEEEGIV
jgi:hypothetical protein